MTLSLSRLDWTTSKHVVGRSRATKWELSLLLRSSKARIPKQAVWSMDSAWSHGHGLVQLHRLTLRLVLWRLFQSLTLLLPMLPVLLFFDVDLLGFAGSLAICDRGLPCGLTKGR